MVYRRQHIQHTNTISSSVIQKYKFSNENVFYFLDDFRITDLILLSGIHFTKIAIYLKLHIFLKAHYEKYDKLKFNSNSRQMKKKVNFHLDKNCLLFAFS